MSDNNKDNWHYASQTAKMLMQTIAHIELSMHEGQDSIGTLTDTFNSMGTRLGQLKQGLDTLQLEADHPELLEDLSYCQSNINQAIVSMQFYDALTQRLETVTKGLLAMSQLVEDRQRRDQESAWQGLQEQIRTSCSIHTDTVFLQAIAEGKGFAEAHRLARESLPAEDDIELF